MPANTRKLAIPYPLATDKVSDYPAIARSAAELIDSAMPVFAGRPMLGGTPKAPFIVQAGWETVTTDGNGNASITFPSAFPNGILAISLLPFNYGQAGDRTAVLYETTVLDKANFRVFQSNGSTLPTTTCGWVYLAIGW